MGTHKQAWGDPTKRDCGGDCLNVHKGEGENRHQILAASPTTARVAGECKGS